MSTAAAATTTTTTTTTNTTTPCTDGSHSCKRVIDESTAERDSETEQYERRKRLNLDNNRYNGFSFRTSSSTPSTITIPTVSSTTSPKDFFHNYVSKRLPCVIIHEDTATSSSLSTSLFRTITPTVLQQIAGDETIQVEQRPHTQAPFGQNRTTATQTTLTVSEFLQQANPLLYWSTQENNDNKDDGDPFQTIPAIRRLYQHNLLPPTFPSAGHLKLSSVNVWMGHTATTTTESDTTTTSSSSSSGLHHDYHDNFYCLLQGQKQFVLLSPDCAKHMDLYGEIDCVYPNGTISYVGNETRADGVPLELLRELQKGNGEEEDSKEEEEEFAGAFGNALTGTDPAANDGDDDDDDDFDETGTDDYDELVGVEDEDAGDDNGSQCDEIKSGSVQREPERERERPNNFSRIGSSKEILSLPFPKCVVDLQAGQSLYLPAGFFHEVTSSGGIHMAVNYWYHPPDNLEQFETPYRDAEFWSRKRQP